jgi:hypothetical protein
MPEIAPTPKSSPSVRRLLQIFYALPVLFVLSLCGYMGYRSMAHKAPPVRRISSAPFATVKIDGLEAHFFTQGDALRAAGNDLFIEFRDGQGKLTEVGDVALELVLKMPGAVLHSIGKVMRTATPGQYRTTLEPGLAGEWTAALRISGPQGHAEASFSVKVM